MKKWTNPSVEELNLNDTQHGWGGAHYDGGYVGDGHATGHSTNNAAECADPGHSGSIELFRRHKAHDAVVPGNGSVRV